ncbi:hypothetical protein LSH36_1009g01008 [Paralvinella palmiformis]|uniref:Fibrinogen C-terminal domain-containing protein n=1 Tax=Paralvinella palmiformis TaxID=53620 RepID=A0AAD9IWJ6_9ANNE|nr:hypothetical protein LSH36_1009g01008 [Paralvinella palmiformis]
MLEFNARGKFIRKTDDPCGSVLCNNGGSCQSDGSCQCTTYCFGSECDDCIIGTQRPVSTPLKINNVQCDVLIEGGWILLMRRMDGSVNFYRGWSDYKVGFGDLATEFWIGNECIHLLTNNGSSFRIRFDMINLNGDWLWAEYSDFSIGPESDKYRLSIHGYNGIAAYLDNMKFTTPDDDNDLSSDNCAVETHGSWWHNMCSLVMFTGYYGSGYNSDGVKWKPAAVDLPFADMKIKVV